MVGAKNQLSGTPVTLISGMEAVATFAAPVVDGQAMDLNFKLVGTEGDLVASDEVTFTVEPDPTGRDEPPPPPCGVLSLTRSATTYADWLSEMRRTTPQM